MLPTSPTTIAYVRFLTRHYRKMFVLVFGIIFGLTLVSVAKYKFMIEQTDQSSYDWTVSTSQQSFDRDALEWARRNRGVGDDDARRALAAFDRRRLQQVDEDKERSDARDYLTLIYQHEQLNSTANIINAANLQTMCEVENVVLSHPAYGKYCFNGESTTGHTEDARGRRCARQRLTITALYYLAWQDLPVLNATTGAVYDFADLPDSSRAFIEIFSGIPAVRGEVPSGAPRRNDRLYDQHARICDRLPDAYVEQRTADLVSLVEYDSDAKAVLGVFFSKAVEKNARTELTRSNMIVTGAPLPGFRNADDRTDEQADLLKPYFSDLEARMWAHFALVNTNSLSAYKYQGEAMPVEGVYPSAALRNGLDVRYIGPWVGYEFERVVNGDLLWVMGSVGFVYCYIMWHTQSPFLASMGLAQIFLSLPVAFFAYRVIGQVDYFVQLHILTIFLVLGVGADDVFVFVDSIKQANVLPELDTQFKRMLFAFSHSAASVLSTSFTTSIAFVSTAITPVMPICSFGIYAALAIMVNFIFTVTLMPLVIHVWQNDATACWERLRCRPRPTPVPWGLDEALPTTTAEHGGADAAHAAKAKGAAEAEAGGALGAMPPAADEPTKASPYAHPGERLRLGERVFRGYYATALNWAPNKARPWLKPVSLGLVVLLGVLGAVGADAAFKLRPPTKIEQWFTNDHMYSGFSELSTARFLSGSDDQFLKASLVFGISGLERGDDFVIWNPSENRGKAVFDGALDITSRKGQQAFKQVCDRFLAAECKTASCVGQRKFVRTGDLDCLIDDFDAWYVDKHWDADVAYVGADDRPTGDSFLRRLKEFTKSAYGSAKAAGFIDGELKWLEIPFTSTLNADQSYAVTIAYYDEAMATLDEIKRDVDRDGLLGERAYVFAGQAFTWIMTEVALVANVIQGFAICFPACFVVLVVATGSPLISLYAIVTIALIVAVTLGFCQGVMGWGLGVAETISSTIVIGFSVDYVVHLGHSYRESAHASREGKTSDALTQMGITVIAGAVTTFGSGLFMFGCQMTFFTKMATLIVLVISSSITYALCFFMPLCALGGPQGKMLTLGEYAQQAAAYVRERRARKDRHSVGVSAIDAAPAEAAFPAPGASTTAVKLVIAARPAEPAVRDPNAPIDDFGAAAAADASRRRRTSS